MLERDAEGSLFAHLFKVYVASEGVHHKKAQFVEIAAHSGQQKQAISQRSGANVSIIYGEKSRKFLAQKWGQNQVIPLFEDPFTIGALSGYPTTPEPYHDYKAFMASYIKRCVVRFALGFAGPFYISRNDWAGKHAAGSAMGKADWKIIQGGAKWLAERGGLTLTTGETLRLAKDIANWFVYTCVQAQTNLTPLQVISLAKELTDNPLAITPIFLIPAGFRPKSFETLLASNFSDKKDPLRNVAYLGLNPKANNLEKEFFSWLKSPKGTEAIKAVDWKMGLNLVVNSSDFQVPQVKYRAPRSFFASTLTGGAVSHIAELPPTMDSTLSELKQSIKSVFGTIESTIRTIETIVDPSSRPYVNDTKWPSATAQLSKANENIHLALMYVTVAVGGHLPQDEVIKNTKQFIKTAKAHIASAPGYYANITETIHIAEHNLEAFETASNKFYSAQEAMTDTEKAEYIEAEDLIIGDTVQIPTKYAIAVFTRYGDDTHTADARRILVYAALAGASLSVKNHKQFLNIKNFIDVEVSTLANALGLESREIVDIWLQDLGEHNKNTLSHLQTREYEANENIQETRIISVVEMFALNGVRLTKDSQEFILQVIYARLEQNRSLSNH